MKKESIVWLTLICCALVSCWHHNRNEIKVSESPNYYSMDAWFHEYRTEDVEEYMDDKIGRENNISFLHRRIDGRLTLDDHTTFFIQKIPGHIRIRLDKKQNSRDSYRKIKSLCEGITSVLR